MGNALAMLVQKKQNQAKSLAQFLERQLKSNKKKRGSAIIILKFR